MNYVIEQGRKVDLFPSDIDLAQARRLMQIYKINTTAAMRYQPHSYIGKIILFQATEKEEDIPLEPDFGWKDYASEGVEIIRVPGNHQYMVKSPHVQVLAEKLKIYIQTS